MDTKTAIEKAISKAGGQKKLAAALGVKQQAVSRWKRTGFPPPNRVLAIESASGVSRHLLRPDLYPCENNSAA